MGKGAPSVIVVDPMELRRAGLLALIEPWATTNNVSVVAVAPSELNTEAISELDPRCVIFSVGGDSLHATQLCSWAAMIRRLLPDTPCLVLSDRTEPEEAILAAQLGEQAFMSTGVHPRVALLALSVIMSGGTCFPREALLCVHGQADASPSAVMPAAERLTSRQLQVLAKLRLGESNKAIARGLDMQESTVKVHVRRIMRSLGAVNRTQAVVLAERSRDQVETPREHPVGPVSAHSQGLGADGYMNGA